jgi:hypothetical protein
MDPTATGRWPAVDQRILQTLMIPLAVVVLDELARRSSEMPFAQRNHPVVVCENSTHVLRGIAVVELEQASEPLATLHLACSDHGRLRRDELVAETLVRPFLMVMVDKFSDSRPEMPFAEQHQSLQAVGLGGLDKSFGKRVQIGTPRRENQRRDATVPQAAPKGRRVQRISVQDDALHAAQESVAGGGQVPHDLHHPPKPESSATD